MTASVTTCTCPGSRTTITFAAELALLRCTHCGAQAWVLAGHAVSADVAHTALRGSFVENRPDPTAPRGPRRVHAPAATHVVDLTGGPASGKELQSALDEVLASKGVPGSWQLSA